MDANKSNFAERLKKIEERRPPPIQSEAAMAGGPRLDGMKADAGEGRAGSPDLTRMLGMGIAGAFVISIGLVTFEMLTAPEPPIPDAAELDFAPPQAQAGFFSFLGGGGSEMAIAPMDYLPPAPSGWYRVTAEEAKDFKIYGRIGPEWEAATGGAPNGLANHPGQPALLAFLQSSGRTTPEDTERAVYTASAIYLDRSGSHVVAEIEFLRRSASLGSTDAPDMWAGELAAQLNGALPQGQVVHRQGLGSRTFFMTLPYGADPPASIETRMRLDHVTPITNRTVLRFSGTGSIADAAAIAAEADQDALFARLATPE